ncbi:MAG: aspartate kinase [Thermacetogeniaceae bacterium]
MPIIVQKFGGTSVASPDLIRNVARRVAKTRDQGKQVVVVVSAMGHTTDKLFELARAVGDCTPEREMDMLLATGEQVSIALLAMALKGMGYPAVSLTGAQAGIITDNAHTKARILSADQERIRQELGKGNIVVVAGFQGTNARDETTTLGRGGSDTTAVALAAALNAEVCEIYTDVDGVYTADPRLLPEAQKLDRISYDEMLELASLGALVLQARSVEYAKHYGVTIHVRSSFNDNRGTLVKEVSGMEECRLLSGVAHDVNVAKIGLFDVPDRPGIAKHLFRALAAEKIDVDMIIQSWMRSGKNDIVFTVTRDDLPRALPVVERVVGEIGAAGMDYNDHMAKVSIVGAGMVSNPGVAADMFEALADENININMISTSEIKISCVIEENEVLRAVRAIHTRMIEKQREQTAGYPPKVGQPTANRVNLTSAAKANTI